MSKAVAISSEDPDAHYKALTEHYLAETRKVLNELAVERKKDARRRKPRKSIVDEVKAILRGG